MENGVVLQSKVPVMPQEELAGLAQSFTAGKMPSSEENTERNVDETSQNSKPCTVRPREQTKKDIAGSRELAVHFEDSGESNEDIDPSEDSLTTSLTEFSVLQRLGLHRVALTEQDVEAAFAHLSLAFRCDMFTLRKRVQVEERARNTAEENIRQELTECRATLQKLDQACLDARHKDLIEHLQSSLAVLARAVERATTAAEKLGAVHQEARMSRATEVMVQHVENLKRHHLREHTELEEMKRLIQQNSRNRQLAENRDDGEQRLKHPPMRMFQQGSARRRVSIAVIPRQLTFHSHETGRGSEEETVKLTTVEGESSERQSHYLQEGSPENYFIPNAGPSNFSHQSLEEVNRTRCDRERSHCREERESELRRRISTAKTLEEKPKDEWSGKDLNEVCEDLEETTHLSKESKLELCRIWFSMPTYYWVLLWLFFLGIACLIVIRILEVQKHYPLTTSEF